MNNLLSKSVLCFSQ